MRKIEHDMCDAIADEKDWQKANTKVINFYNDQKQHVVTSVFLHDNLIAELTDDSLTVFDGGWQSNTTKSRLNALINRFADGATDGVFQREHKWFIRDRNVTKEFISGYVFN